jgi:FtsP/CotA-like multicopper oxidase with cupredoxin domain
VVPSASVGSSERASAWSGQGGIVQFVDLHAAEHSWEISPGAAVHGYGFNGQVPGPVIEATVGDRLLVQFSNGTDRPSALVWHAPSMAFTPLSTSPPHWVLPGGTDRAEQTLRQPGAFLYRATSQPDNPNVLGGLYGVLLVKGPAEPVVDEERVLVVHHAANPDQRRTSGPAIGRPGPLGLLINGVRHVSVGMRAGTRERWRILNIAADIQLQLTLPPLPARATGRADCCRNGRAALVPLVTTLPAAGSNLEIGPFTRSQQVSLDAVIAGDGPASHYRQLLTCQVI